MGSFAGIQINQEAWTVPILGGTPRRVGDVTGGDGTWMPNGDILISHESVVLRTPKESGPFTNFIEPGAFAWWLRWSPDGRALRFSRNEQRSEGNDLWEVTADGKNQHRVLGDWRPGKTKVMGDWTPDGKFYVFDVNGDDHDDLWAVRESGDWFHKVDRRPIQLTSGPLNFNAPVPSLDGKKIFAIGSQLRAELSRYDAKAGQFVPFMGGISASSVSFSPDGKWVAYMSVPDWLLWRSRVDGSDKLQLDPSPVFADSTQWSPDSTRIAYVSHWTGHPDHLCVVGKDGGSATVLYENTSVSSPTWMSNGSAIVVAAAGSTADEDAELKLVDTKTRDQTPIIDSKGVVRPAISPDGRYLVSPSGDGTKLRLYDFQTKSWQDFTPPAGAGMAKWSQDGHYVYFDNGWSTEPAIYRMRITDHKIEQVTSLKNFRRTAFGEFPWLGLTPAGEPLVMRDVSSQEVYALDFEQP